MPFGAARRLTKDSASNLLALLPSSLCGLFAADKYYQDLFPALGDRGMGISFPFWELFGDPASSTSLGENLTLHTVTDRGPTRHKRRILCTTGFLGCKRGTGLQVQRFSSVCLPLNTYFSSSSPCSCACLFSLISPTKGPSGPWQ